jgi:magnesium transporter
MKVDQVVDIGQGADRCFWVDIENPSKAELEAIAEKYRLPHRAVQDCLDAEHLPKFERFGDLNFIIVRSYDENAAPDADTVQELTRKVALFESQGFLITIHRVQQFYLEQLKEEWRSRAADGEACRSNSMMLSVLSRAIQTYEPQITINRDLLEEFETKVFHHAGESLEDGYYLKRRANTFKRMLRMTLDILPSVAAEYKDESSAWQDVKETGDRLYFYAEDFFENVNNLLTLYLTLSSHRMSAASHRTNEVMRILTVFSVFFMPLNLITGIYGMNFQSMPELGMKYGYPAALILMLIVTASIWMYFKRKGVLEPNGHVTDLSSK